MPPRTWSKPARISAAAVIAAFGVGTLTAPTAAALAPTGPAAEPASASRAGLPAATGRAVESTVREVRVPGVDTASARQLRAGSLDNVVALSPAVNAPGYATVGVTWTPGGEVAAQELFVRTRTGARWSGWEALPAEAEHGPTPGSPEASHAVPGTDPAVVGAVDVVQVKATAPGGKAPRGLTLSVIDPGQPVADRGEAFRLGSPDYPRRRKADGVTPRPAIYSREQWGADEGMRNGFAGYGKIRGAFVHHTVNANTYSRADVPGILRSIYAYHTQSRGWSDVGYNFLVDRFGRVWEGRYGGIGRPVIGAHTLDYNEEAFAMSAIGNFDLVKPRKSMLRAYGRLFAWKLSKHGVRARSTVTLDGRPERAINGHRDAASTACPGSRLYGRLPSIRKRAARVQSAWANR